MVRSYLIIRDGSYNVKPCVTRVKKAIRMASTGSKRPLSLTQPNKGGKPNKGCPKVPYPTVAEGRNAWRSRLSHRGVDAREATPHALEATFTMVGDHAIGVKHSGAATNEHRDPFPTSSPGKRREQGVSSPLCLRLIPDALWYRRASATMDLKSENAPSRAWPSRLSSKLRVT